MIRIGPTEPTREGGGRFHLCDDPRNSPDQVRPPSRLGVGELPDTYGRRVVGGKVGPNNFLGSLTEMVGELQMIVVNNRE